MRPVNPRPTVLVVPVYLDAVTIVMGAIHSRIQKLAKTSGTSEVGGTLASFLIRRTAVSQIAFGG